MANLLSLKSGSWVMGRIYINASSVKHADLETMGFGSVIIAHLILLGFAGQGLSDALECKRCFYNQKSGIYAIEIC
ncbi:expressed protein [Arabidopsis lyrata subsp. lyrata]|uniref:Expressed protein n=1 Tax=Arabidopsis lyrata subsp. lyrata TaxID=81972 RepID=D7KP68_ARALL|nr:expressed protein [Arabidopsis lyrata subsp. lyrata]